MKKGKKKNKLPKALEENKWKPGQSGNPKGRPKKLPALDKLLAEALGDTTEDGRTSKMKKLIEQLISDATTKSSLFRTRAAEVLLDRAYGRAKDAPPLPEDKPQQITGFKLKKK
jgi:hypothetical protein